MIHIRINEDELIAVMKGIKRYFSRLVRSLYNEEGYQSCKRNIGSMYIKIKERFDEKYRWDGDFRLVYKASELSTELGDMKYIYDSFIQYSKTPNNLKKFKVEVTLSIYLAKQLDKFLEKEIEYQFLFSKKIVKELGKLFSFQDTLKRSISSYKDNSVSVSMKAEKYNVFEETYEKYINKELYDKGFEEKVNTFDSPFEDESNLHKLGYKITGLTRTQRWNILANKAIPQLGLDQTVKIITGLIETRKLQKDGETKFAHAIKEWNYDLSKLADYYLLK